MIISDIHKYVYIGIPRTGSKSMNHWLMEYFDGKWYGDHHDYNVPEEFAEYLIFTIVRNPYDRATSGYFGVTWDDQGSTEDEIGPWQTEQERLRKSRAVLATREKQQPKNLPQPSYFNELLRTGELRHHEEGSGMSQKRFVEKGRVNLVLYFERLPDCLVELPFVDPNNVPPFPHHPERGARPSGNFFDFFCRPNDEQILWPYIAEDFEAFGYRRFDCGLPEDAPNALRTG
jgi:hypothetical protein